MAISRAAVYRAVQRVESGPCGTKEAICDPIPKIHNNIELSTTAVKVGFERRRPPPHLAARLTCQWSGTMSSSRPNSQHRLSVGSNASSLPARNSYNRAHSHTASLSAVNPTNRINRRKSSTFSPAGKPTITGAAVENAVADGSAAVNRRTSMSKAALATLNDGATPSSLPHHVSVPDGAILSSSAVVDGAPLASYQGTDKSKPKMRRASDGTRLTKKEKAATGDLKCETCGKAYKHGSCLNKHL